MDEDLWLSARFGHPVLTVGEADVARGADALLDDIAQRGPASYQAKVGAEDVAGVATLERAGFTVVDVNVTLARAGEVLGDPGEAVVREAGPDDREEVLRIAEQDYRVSRFHLDPEIPDRVAATVKRDWMQACLDGERGERVLVAEAPGGAVAGFLAVLATDAARVIDLVAVAEDRRGSGAGTALVRRFLTHCAEAGVRAEVGSQVSNVGALRLYEELGFRTAATRYVLHRHERPSWSAA